MKKIKEIIEKRKTQAIDRYYKYIANSHDEALTQEERTQNGKLADIAYGAVGAFDGILRTLEQEGYDDEYSGDHYVGEIVMFRTHQCKVTHVWKDEEGNNGISLIPTGNYGFEIDVTEKRFEEMNKKGVRR
jgi:hypothetical protein